MLKLKEIVTEQDKIYDEIKFCESEEFEKGKYLYMFMLDVNGITRCFGVGYTIDYAFKKGLENTDLIFGEVVVKNPRINKILVGETEKMDTFDLSNKMFYIDEVQTFAFADL